MSAMVDVILPVLDEAEALPWVLGRMPAGFAPLVVDNGSRGGSAAVAQRLGARVVHEARRGYGAACSAGLVAATGDVVCFMDADGSLDPAALPRLAAALDGADLVVGARRPLPGAWPWHGRVATALLVAELRRRGGPRVHDLGAMRAGRRSALLALGVRDTGFGWPMEVLVRAGAAGWRVTEVDVAYGARRGGRSKVTGSLRGGLRAARDLRAALA